MCKSDDPFFSLSLEHVGSRTFFWYLCAGIQRSNSLSHVDQLTNISKNTKEISKPYHRIPFLCLDVIPTFTQTLERVALPRSVTQSQGAGSCNLKIDPLENFTWLK
jgi:hypothetical protein